MVTFLDVTLLEKFGSIFSFLLVTVIVYGIASYTKLFGDNKVMHWFLAFLVGVLVLFSPTATGMIKYMTPWFVIMFFFIVFIIIAYKLFGISDESIVATVKKGLGIQWTIFIFGFIILISAFAANLGRSAYPYLEDQNATTNVTATGQPSVATSDIGKNTAATIFHPKVLGMLLIMLIATATIGLIGGSGKIRS